MSLWTIQNERAELSFHAGQSAAWRSDRRITAAIAGTQSGKTSFGPWWLWREIRERGAGDYFAVTATFDLFKLKMLPEIRTVFETVLGVGRYWAGDRILELREGAQPDGALKARISSDPMWARIILRSADAPGGLESGTGKAAWLDEAGQDRFTLLAWRAIRRRLAINEGRILITTTLYNLGWLKQQVMDRATGARRLIVLDNGAEVEVTDGDDVRLVQFDSIANPLFPVSEYQDAEQSLPGDEFAMFYRGRAAKLRTLIYDCFDEDIHVVPSFAPPRHWPRVVGVDPVGAHIAAVWLAYDEEKGQLHLYREYKEPYGLATREHARSILEQAGGERIAQFVGGGPSERQARTDWSVAGLPLSAPPTIDVWSQIRRVYALFKTLGLVVHGGCIGVLDELGSYQRQRDRAGDLTDKIRDKERYDLLDALRYAVAWLLSDEQPAQWVYAPKRIGR